VIQKSQTISADTPQTSRQHLQHQQQQQQVMLDRTEHKETTSTQQHVSTEMTSKRDQVQQALGAERSSNTPSSSVAGVTSSTSSQLQQPALVPTQASHTSKHL